MGHIKPSVVVPIKQYSWSAIKLYTELKVPDILPLVDFILHRDAKLVPHRGGKVEPAHLGLVEVVRASITGYLELFSCCHLVLQSKEILKPMIRN